MNLKIWLTTTAIALLCAPPVFGQTFPKSFRTNHAEPQEGLTSNVVTDVVVREETIWFGTGRGLSRTRDDGLTFETFAREQGIGRGGVSGLAVADDIIWVATGFDSTADALQTGGGLAYTTDDGETWMHVPQPGDTPIQNITFDIALRGEEVWITSFGGGLRKSENRGVSWEIVTPDSFIFDPLNRLNHRAFSVLVVDTLLWVGTAGGINRSTDGGRTWTNFGHANQERGISGNFVVAIAHQNFQGREVIWAATRETTVESGDETEFRGISWSEDQGFTWHTALRGETVHNIAFEDSVVYAASDNGLFKSIDGGETWFVFPPIENPDGLRRILSNRVFDAGVSQGHVLWAGTSNGLARTMDNGSTWQVFQVFRPTGVEDAPRTYAYPNPFSPSIHNQLDGIGHVRFQYNTISDTRVTLKIYDYAMEHVATVVDAVPRPGNRDLYEIWDGRASNGRLVANGVYFYRLELAGDGVYWGKLVVLK